jgi:primosomal protein N' (replication factor Y)
MLTQVSGRTGRDSDAGSVIIQTYDPEHMSVKLAAEHAYEPFFESEAALRAELLYPPFGRLILIRIEGTSDKKVERKAAEIARSARLMLTRIGNVAILGPAPAPRQKLVGKFRRQVLLKSATRGPLRALVRGLIEEGKLKGEAVKVTVDVDPMDML